MRNILFVDDEEAVLDSLQDSLRTHRRRWNMSFACGGESAISQMASDSFDVIVSDIRMPGVNGVEVLQYAKDHHPKTVRIALTGYADDTSTIELTKVAHRFLTKPCSIKDLDSTICRDSGLVAAFDLPAVQELAGATGRLPVGDSVQQKLMQCLNADDISVGELSVVVEKDVALTAKVLQLVNSSFFRRKSTILCARQAVTYLGIDVIRSLLLADQLFNSSQELTDNSKLDVKALHRHSMLCSSIAKAIAPDDEIAAASMTAGLLHDIGKLLIARSKPELIDSLHDENSHQWVDATLEREILGCTHAEVGGYFLNLWGIPTEVVEAVTFHDNPSSVFSSKLDAVGVVHFSNYFANSFAKGFSKDNQGLSLEEKLDANLIANLGLEEKIGEWREIAMDVANDNELD